MGGKPCKAGRKCELTLKAGIAIKESCGWCSIVQRELNKVAEVKSVEKDSWSRGKECGESDGVSQPDSMSPTRCYTGASDRRKRLSGMVNLVPDFLTIASL